jgi:hypothetical protein
MDERQLRIETARFLKRAREQDPERYRQIAARHPVLSTYRIDRKREQEVELREDAEDEQGEYQPSPVAREIHREWLATAFQEVA